MASGNLFLKISINLHLFFFNFNYSVQDVNKVLDKLPDIFREEI